MKQKTRLTEHERENEDRALDTATATRVNPLEFATPEDALRCDRNRVEVPASVAARLAESLRSEPPPPKPAGWWRRWFGR